MLIFFISLSLLWSNHIIELSAAFFYLSLRFATFVFIIDRLGLACFGNFGTVGQSPLSFASTWSSRRCNRIDVIVFGREFGTVVGGTCNPEPLRTATLGSS